MRYKSHSSSRLEIRQCVSTRRFEFYRCGKLMGRGYLCIGHTIGACLQYEQYPFSRHDLRLSIRLWRSRDVDERIHLYVTNGNRVGLRNLIPALGTISQTSLGITWSRVEWLVKPHHVCRKKSPPKSSPDANLGYGSTISLPSYVVDELSVFFLFSRRGTVWLI